MIEQNREDVSYDWFVGTSLMSVTPDLTDGACMQNSAE